MKKNTTPRTRLSRPAFVERVAGAVGLEVSHTWQGYGSAIFLELGRLRRVEQENNPRGQYSVMVEWSWRVESPRSVEFGSWSRDRKIATGLASLQGHTVTAITVEGRLPELVIELSGGRWLHSFMTAEGQPRWVVFLPGGECISVERGGLVWERESPGTDSSPRGDP
jgi:hypothetical protein